MENIKLTLEEKAYQQILFHQVDQMNLEQARQYCKDLIKLNKARTKMFKELVKRDDL